MIKSISAIAAGTLLAISMTAQADGKTGGEDAYYIDTRGPVQNNVEVHWKDSSSKGGDAYNGSMQSSSNFKVYYVAPVPKGGDQ